MLRLARRWTGKGTLRRCGAVTKGHMAWSRQLTCRSAYGPKKRKSKKRRSRRSRKARPGRAPIGIDFGCLPENAALSTLEFPTLLSNASIVGVAYGEAWSDALEVPVPSLTLVAERPEPLRQAFEIFSAWSASTDGDSVEITVILRTAGGYLLVISPEFERLMQRCLGFDRTESSFAFSLHWCMPINTTHHQLEQLRSYLRAANGALPVQWSCTIKNPDLPGSRRATGKRDTRAETPTKV